MMTDFGKGVRECHIAMIGTSVQAEIQKRVIRANIDLATI